MAEKYGPLALIACTVALFAIGFRTDAQILQPCAVDSGSGVVGLCIGNMDLTVKGNTEVILHAQVTNVRSLPIKGKTWWVVASLGAGPPWVRSIFQSSTDVRTYAGNATNTLGWDTVLTLPGGFYDVGLIVHRVNIDGSEVHADWRYVGPIHVAAA